MTTISQGWMMLTRDQALIKQFKRYFCRIINNFALRIMYFSGLGKSHQTEDKERGSAYNMYIARLGMLRS